MASISRRAKSLGPHTGAKKRVPNQNAIIPVTSSEVGLTRKSLHEAREIRDAEKEEPGIIRRAKSLGPKYGPDKTNEPIAVKHGDNKPPFLETVMGKNIIKSRTGELAQLRKHLFDTGEGLEYLWAIYHDILRRHPHGLGGLQKWARRYDLGIIPLEIIKELQAREKEIPFSFDADAIGELLNLLYEERKKIKFWHANPIDKTREQVEAIKAFENRESDRERKEKKRRETGAKSKIEIQADARKKELQRKENEMSRTTEWRRRNKPANATE